MRSLIEARRGTKKANRGLERMCSVSHVMKKWNEAKVSWQSFQEGSEKMALLVKTWGGC
jgi:hypothetical protein